MEYMYETAACTTVAIDSRMAIGLVVGIGGVALLAAFFASQRNQKHHEISHAKGQAEARAWARAEAAEARANDIEHQLRKEIKRLLATSELSHQEVVRAKCNAAVEKERARVADHRAAVAEQKAAVAEAALEMKPIRPSALPACFLPMTTTEGSAPSQPAHDQSVEIDPPSPNLSFTGSLTGSSDLSFTGSSTERPLAPVNEGSSDEEGLDVELSPYEVCSKCVSA